MPPSVPDGMRLELLRARIKPGKEARITEWMAMLHERYQECLDVLPAERMAFESTFRHTDVDGSVWIYHLSLYGECGSELDESNSVSEAHATFSRECKEPGWQILRPELLLIPNEVRDALTRAGSGQL